MSTPFPHNVFDLAQARRGQDGVKDPSLNRTFWHGTRMCFLESILRDGLIPAKTKVGATCLASDPAIALAFGRIEHTLNPHSPLDVRPVLIKIDGSRLRAPHCVVEQGAVDLFAYGEKLPGRTRAELKDLATDWRSFHFATNTLGYTDVIEVDASMVETRVCDLPKLPFPKLRKEFQTGKVTNRATRDALAALTSPDTLMVA